MKSIRMFVTGLIVGALLATAGSAFAASETVRATIAKLRFVVNGEERELRTDPLVVKGTTYLPVREVANMLGYDVTYRADSRTVEFNMANDSAKKGASNVTETIIDTAWISLRDLAEQYELMVRQTTDDGKNYVVTRGDEVLLNIYYDPKSSATALTPQNVEVEARAENGRILLNLNDLKAAGIIQ